MKPIVKAIDAISDISDGAVIMIGGFMCCGQAFKLIDALLDKGSKYLTVICNDAGYPDKGIGKLIVNNRVSKLITSHIGLNPVAGEKMLKKELEVELVPQGSLAEKIRSAGAGLGGVLTPTGIGTEVEKIRQKIILNNKEWILEPALSADFAFIYSTKCDTLGNAFLEGATKNFNLIMAMAANISLLETDEIVSVGQLNQEIITIPNIFINKIVKG